MCRRLAVLLLAVAMLTGCVRTIAGHPVPADGMAHGPVSTSLIQGGDGGEIDQLAAAGLTDLQSYWRQHFEDIRGEPWVPLTGGFHSVAAGGPAPPCLQQAGDIEGTAYYCPGADAIAWDRATLLPALVERFGEAAVVIVLAHEMGHAVQHRLAPDRELPAQQSQTPPTVLTEAMADCYAGSFLRWAVDGHAEHLDIDRDELDLALGALVIFRDPVATATRDAAAHGSAFARVASFQAGFEHGPQLCAGFSMSNREFPRGRVTGLTAATTGDTLPLPDLIATFAADLDAYFARIVTQRGGRWTAPQLRVTDRPPDCSGRQGPVAFCPDAGTIEVNGSGELARLHAVIGDHAPGVLLASRYALAARDALGRSIDGRVAAGSALCLAGAYTGDLLAGGSGPGLSPGTLDEAVQLVLARDYAALDARGEGRTTGFERVTAFRTGTLQGPNACGL